MKSFAIIMSMFLVAIISGTASAASVGIGLRHHDEVTKETCEKTCDFVYEGRPDYAQECKVNSCNFPEGKNTIGLRQVPQDEVTRETCEKTCDFIYQGRPDYAQECKVNSCNLPENENTSLRGASPIIAEFQDYVKETSGVESTCLGAEGACSSHAQCCSGQCSNFVFFFLLCY